MKTVRNMIPILPNTVHTANQITHENRFFLFHPPSAQKRGTLPRLKIHFVILPHREGKAAFTPRRLR